MLDKQLHALDWHSASYRLYFGQKYHVFTHGWPFDGEFEDPVEVIAGQTFFPRLNTSVSFTVKPGQAFPSLTN